ncbi:MAG: hypothetical protein MUP16_10305 [Sedimentisphaerales bacterium]|nr:hypothetical protein [Sedimentisphaerales bacterium]
MGIAYDFGPLVLTFIGAILALFSKERKWTRVSGLVLACLGLILGLATKIADRSASAKKHSAAISSLLLEVYSQSNNLMCASHWPEVRTIEMGKSLLLSTDQLEMKLNHYANDLPISILQKTEETIEAQKKVAIALTDKSKLDPSFPILVERAWTANHELGKSICQECSDAFTRSVICGQFFENLPDPPPLPPVTVYITNNTAESVQVSKKGLYIIFEKYIFDLGDLVFWGSGSLTLSHDTEEISDSIIIKDGNIFKITGILSSSYGIAELFKKGNHKVEFIFSINDSKVSKIAQFSQNSFKSGIDLKLTKLDMANDKRADSPNR